MSTPQKTETNRFIEVMSNKGTNSMRIAEAINHMTVNPNVHWQM